MLTINKKIKEITGCSANDIPEHILISTEPLVLKGLVADWPIVKAAQKSPRNAADYIAAFYQNKPITAAVGVPEIKGRIFYNEDLSGFNYQSHSTSLNSLLNKIFLHQNDSKPPTLYMASTLVDTWLPGFRAANDITLNDPDPLVSIWMGNRSRIGAHYDLPDNMACNVVGRRRFTLFPPEQLHNLYAGPLDLAPGGVPISLVDFHQPDYTKFPKFREALGVAQVTELEPGDAIFIPSMWWHHVESLDAFNVLVNYWWRQSPAYMSTPMNTLYHGLLTIRDLPAEQKQAWQGIFEHYVFNSDVQTSAHIPKKSQGFLAPIDEDMARKLRALLLNKLNR